MKNELLAPNGKPSNLNATQYELVRTPAFKKWFGDWEKDPANSSKVVDENGEPLVVYRGMPKKRRVGNIFRYNVNMFGTKGVGSRKTNKFAFYFTDIKEVADEYGRNLSDDNDSEWIIKEYFLNIRNIFKAFTKKNEYELIFKKLYDLANKTGNKIYAKDSTGEILTDRRENKIEWLDYYDMRDYYKNESYFKPVYSYFSDWNKDDENQAFWRVYLKDFLGYDGLVFYETTWNMDFDKNFDTASPRYGNEYSKSYAVFESNQIKLADGTNTIFDSGNDDIRFAKGGKTKGDCYLVAGQLALEIKNKDIDYNGTPYLVHAEVKHSQIDALRYGHAFIEDDENVYDFSNNREIIMPKQLYYYFGDINPRDKKKYRKYTFKQAREKMLSTGHYGCWEIEVDYEKGGRTIAQTPAPKKDQVKGSDINKKSSSKDLSSAKLIKFDDKTLDAIKNKVKEHNGEHPDKKINLSSAKAVVRRGFGAYSKSHRPTISGGKPNSRVAWGLARLNAFTYKIVNGKSKSGKYSQDDDLIEELGYKVANYENGGKMSKDIRCINCGWEWNRKDSELWDMYVCHKCGFDNTSFYTSDGINRLLKGGRLNSNTGVTPNYLKMFLDL